MKESISLKEKFNALPSELYEAWLDSSSHSLMTGGEAICSDKIGEPFTAWDGYIEGTNLELIQNIKIVQAWRTTEFASEDEDSILTLELRAIETGTELSLKHTNIPAGQTQYQQGWIDHYFEPMKTYFR